VSIQCGEITDVGRYFNLHATDKAFHANEYAFDAKLIGKKMYQEAAKSGVAFVWDVRVDNISSYAGKYCLRLANDTAYSAPWVLNATYAGQTPSINLRDLEKVRQVTSYIARLAEDVSK